MAKLNKRGSGEQAKKDSNTIFLPGSHKALLGALQSVGPTTRKVCYTINFLVAEENVSCNDPVEGWHLLFFLLSRVGASGS